jgi:MFS family permease
MRLSLARAWRTDLPRVVLLLQAGNAFSWFGYAYLAPSHLLGRYISLLSLMVTGGFAIGPAIGGALLATSPDAVRWGGGLIAAVIGAGFLLAGDRIPDKPLAATESKAPPGDPMPEAA